MRRQNEKLSVAVILAGLLVGCGGDGLVKLENKNPTIDQEIYDLYMEKLSKANTFMIFIYH